MFKKFLLFAILCIFSMASFSQNSVNDYKYVIVPNQYDFLDEEDQFQLNSISHFLFNKYGFIALKEDEIFPEDLMFNPCLALKSDVADESRTFKTRLRIELTNCKGELIYFSDFGESFEKKYAIAYNKALRDAFLHLEALNYKYQPNETILAMGTSKSEASKEEIEKLKEELAALKEEKNNQTTPEVVVAETAETVADSTTKTMETLLFAQKTDGGYQLVDKSSKVVMVLLNTRNPEVFIVQGKNAMVFKEAGAWVLSENDGNQVTNTKLNIKL